MCLEREARSIFGGYSEHTWGVPLACLKGICSVFRRVPAMYFGDPLTVFCRTLAAFCGSPQRVSGSSVIKFCGAFPPGPDSGVVRTGFWGSMPQFFM